jgi:kynurenine formamidase
MRIVDLSRPLGGSHTALVPGHPAVEYHEFHSHAVHGRTNATLSFSVHTATHIDPPYHFVADGLTIDQVPLERLMAPGYVFDLRDKAQAGQPIWPDDLPSVPDGFLAGRIVILRTGWGEKAFHRSDYYTSGPYLSVELAQWLVDQGVVAVGLENPPDYFEPGALPHPGDGPVHRTLLGHQVCLIENLANLDQLSVFDPWVVALPLKIYRGCGGPARVVAWEGVVGA